MAYLRIMSLDESQGERERDMINLLMRWTGGTDYKTIFPGKLPWDQHDEHGGVPLETMKALMRFGADVKSDQSHDQLC